MSGKEIKQERSIPVQSRINVIDLANADIYWIKEGYNIKSMSQLVSWSVGLLCEVLAANNVMPRQVDSLVDANRYLIERGLYQPSMKEKARKKLGAALSFESLRAEGTNPKSYVPQQHKILHRKDSVEPFDGEVFTGLKNPEIAKMTTEAFTQLEKIREEERKANLEAAKRSGIVVDADTVTTEASNGTDVRGQTKLNEEELAAYNEGRLAKQRAIYEEKEAKRLKKAAGGVSNVGATATSCVGDQFKDGEEEGDGKSEIEPAADEVVLKEGEVDLEEVRERSDKRIELENQPIDMSQVEVVDGEE